MKQFWKKILLALSLVAGFVVYIIYQRGGFKEQREEGVVTPPVTTPISPDNNLSPATPTPTPAPIPPVTTRKFRDGSYVGDVTDAYYGNVQVKAVIQNGKIADVQFLQYPSDRRTSVEINTQAMPYLKTEAIQAQSANVDIVSGATQTSLAFRQSLASALSQAK